MSIKTKEILEFMIRQDNKMDVMQKQIDGIDMLLTELNHALPDPVIDAECEETAIAADESLARHAVRLGLSKPELKVLDQSVFDGLDKEWRWAAVDKDGKAHRFDKIVEFVDDVWDRGCRGNESLGMDFIGAGYDATNWKKSLIKRESVELTGSDLTRAMLKRGDKFVMCFVNSESDDSYLSDDQPIIVTVFEEYGFYVPDSYYRYAVPIDNNGNVLTQKEAGL